LKGMRERVEGVGGFLSVESAPGEGSTLTVELPVVRLASPSRLERPRDAEEVASTTET
jgi:signal transduction histidine kinase